MAKLVNEIASPASSGVVGTCKKGLFQGKAGQPNKVSKDITRPGVGKKKEKGSGVEKNQKKRNNRGKRPVD